MQMTSPVIYDFCCALNFVVCLNNQPEPRKLALNE